GLQEAVDNLLVIARLSKGFDYLDHPIPGNKPRLFTTYPNVVQRRLREENAIAALLVSLHALLVLAKVNWDCRILDYVPDQLLNRNGAGACSVAAERPVRHELGMNPTRITQEQGRQNLVWP